jgi:hypothetical protein
MLEVKPYCKYDVLSKTLYGTHVSGFYSCINTTRIALYSLISNGIFPENISLEKTLTWYKQNLTDDFYPLLYKKTELINVDPFCFEVFCPTLISYNNIDFQNLVKIENCYFNPSELVSKQIQLLISKYNINYANTVAVLHRGNDKWREAVLKEPKFWIQEIENKLTDTNTKILLQTDEERTKNIITQYFKDKCFIFEEMLFNDTYVKPCTNFEQWAVTFESIMRIISKCQYIITHSGNCGFIPIIYRGNVKQVTQLLSNGLFLDF